MPQYLKQYGEHLIDLGYRIVPLPPGSKGPNRRGWPKFNPDAEQVRQWYGNGSVNDGIGVLASTTPAIDVDILDPDAAEKMSKEIDRIFSGQSLMTRTGLAPKFLVPFKSAEPFRKISSAVYTDGVHDHKVEVLGDGQQWVAYHVHPGTGRPYLWWDGVSDEGIRSQAREDLPELDRETALAVVSAFEVLARERVAVGLWTLKSTRDTTQTNPTDSSPTDPFGDLPVGKTEAQIADLLARHPNTEADYDRWFAVLAAIHHEVGATGRELAYAWSASSTKHIDAKFDTTWSSLGHYTGRQITLRSLMKGDKPSEHKPRAAESDNPFQVHKWTDYKKNYLATPWIIKGVLPRAEVGIVYGQSGSGKTFFVLDMAANVARGVEWRGRKVNGCRVVYVAAEAREGVKKRLDAYDQHVCAEGERPDIIANAPNLLSSDTQALSESIGKAGLIILDTMAASHSGDENSAKDMGLFLNACKDLSLSTGAMVLAVHHTGKEESKGMRGSSALFAGADFVMEVFKNENEHGATLSKSRDDITGTSFSFLLRRVIVGQDNEGDDVTTCVVEPIQKEILKSAKRKTGPSFEQDERFGKQRHYLDILAGLAGLANEKVAVGAWIHAIQNDILVNEMKEPDYPRADSLMRSFHRLSSQGKISVEGQWVRLLA